MFKISSCITFLGNCRKAIDFYKEVFDITDVKIETFGEKTEFKSFNLTPSCRELIFRAVLNINSNGEKFSLILGDSPALLFNMDINASQNNRDNISYEIFSDNRIWVEKAYNKFLEEGKRNTPLEKGDVYALTGSVMDKFGVCWIMNYSE